MTSSDTSDPADQSGHRSSAQLRSPWLSGTAWPAGLAWAALLISDYPLGIPGEWTWQRHSFPSSWVTALDRVVIPCACGAAILLLIRRLVGSRPGSDDVSKLKVLGLAGLLCVCSLVWQNVVSRAAPDSHRLVKPLWVTYDRGASGYFSEARDLTSVDQFLATYEQTAAEGDVLHQGTHPPGLILLHRSLLNACRRWPMTCSMGLFWASDAETNAFREVEQFALQGQPATREEIAAMGLYRGLLQLAVAAAAAIGFLILRRSMDVESAVQLSLLGLLAPGLVVFSPKSDVFFAASNAAILVCGLYGIIRCRRWATIGCGILLFGGLLLSLAHLAVLAALGLATAVLLAFDDAPRIRRASTALWIPASVCLGVVIFGRMTGCDLLSVWQHNLRNHQQFYTQFTRTGAAWIFWNPLELVLTAGVPLVIAGMAGGFRGIAGTLRGTGTVRATAFLGPVAAILLLWLSGKNAGEAARLWCFMIPWLVIIASVQPGAVPTSKDNIVPECGRGGSPLLPWGIVWMQMSLAALTVMRVSGFSF